MPRPARCRHVLPLVAVGAAVLLTACGTGAPPPPPDPFPPRPASIDVSRLDPCTALPASEAERLDLQPGFGGTADVDGVPAPSCGWLGGRETYAYSAQAIPLDAAGAAEEPGSRVVILEGFGAVRSAPTTNNSPNRPAFCQIAVDVAEGQTLRFQLNNGDPDTGGDPAMIEATCGDLERFAGRYLAALRG